MRRNSLMVSLFLLLSLSFSIPLSLAQTEEYAPPSPTVYFRPSVAIVIGIFAMMFSLTFLLLLYAKYCHSNSTHAVNDADVFMSPDRDHSPPQTTGISKAIIESLPFFRFSALGGTRTGMECAVCLSPYTDPELLRLLPACKHAFHLSCVDQWLDHHSSCPLCRTPVLEYKGEADDAIAPNVLSLFVEREPSCRFEEKKKESVHEKRSDKTPEQEYDKFKHRIVISGVALKSRWSDLNSTDLMSLNCDMLRFDSSGRFSVQDFVYKPENVPVKLLDEKALSIKEEIEKKRLLELKANQLSNSGKERSGTSSEPTAVISRASRSMSEIVNFARLRGSREQYPAGPDDQVRRKWLPIAQRTMRWFAGRESRSHMQPQTYTREAVIASNPDYKAEIDIVTSV